MQTSIPPPVLPLKNVCYETTKASGLYISTLVLKARSGKLQIQWHLLLELGFDGAKRTIDMTLGVPRYLEVQEDLLRGLPR